jgi:hypothetical protein
VGPAPLPAGQLLQPPVPPATVRPEDDPAFTHAAANVKRFARDKRAHPPAAWEAGEAQDAALPPADDLAGQAKAAKVDTMDAQQAGSFDKKAFIAAVKTAIEAKSPKTLTPRPTATPPPARQARSRRRSRAWSRRASRGRPRTSPVPPRPRPTSPRRSPSRSRR